MNPLKSFKLKANIDKSNNIQVTIFFMSFDNDKKQGMKRMDLINGWNEITLSPASSARRYRLAIRIKGTGRIIFHHFIMSIYENTVLEKRNEFARKFGNTQDIYAKSIEKLIDGGFSDQQLMKLVQAKAGEKNILDDFYLTHFPQLKGKIITDEDIVPSTKGQTITIGNGNSNQPHFVKFPVDWQQNPKGDRNWNWRFQWLEWVVPLIEGDNKALETAGYVIADWYQSEVFTGEPAEFSWEDHSLARRFAVISQFIESYVTNPQTINISDW